MRTPGRPLISSSCRSSVARRAGCSATTAIEHRPDAELLGALAFQLHLGDAAFDDLDAHLAVLDVLRRHDGAAEMEAGGTVDVADGGGDRREVGLRHLFADDRVDRLSTSWSGGIARAPVTVT